MGISGIWQWVVVLIIILLLFGTKRIRNIGSDLGSAVKSFRTGLNSKSDKEESTPESTPENSNTTSTESTPNKPEVDNDK